MFAYTTLNKLFAVFFIYYIYIGALKILRVPEYAHGYFSRFLMGLSSDWSYECAYKIWSS